MIMVEYKYKEFKSVLNKFKYTDSWFWARYSLNTYSGWLMLVYIAMLEVNDII